MEEMETAKKKKYSKNKNYNAFRELTEDSISMK